MKTCTVHVASQASRALGVIPSESMMKTCPLSLLKPQVHSADLRAGSGLTEALQAQLCRLGLALQVGCSGSGACAGFAGSVGAGARAHGCRISAKAGPRPHCCVLAFAHDHTLEPNGSRKQLSAVRMCIRLVLTSTFRNEELSRFSSATRSTELVVLGSWAAGSIIRR